MLSFVLLLLFSLSSCRNAVEHGGKTPVVQVGNRYLYQEDIASLLPYGLSVADSLAFVRDFTRKWLEEQVLYEKAEHNIRVTGE